MVLGLTIGIYIFCEAVPTTMRIGTLLNGGWILIYILSGIAPGWYTLNYGINLWRSRHRVGKNNSGLWLVTLPVYLIVIWAWTVLKLNIKFHLALILGVIVTPFFIFAFAKRVITPV